MKTLPYYLVDVFAYKPYTGNQLAVFLEADGLSVREMLNITREINFAESVFIMNGNAANGNGVPGNGFHARVFTPEKEVPFAGHPTLGAAFVLKKLANRDLSSMSLKLPIGDIPIEFMGSNGQEEIFMTQPQPEMLSHYDPKEMAELLQLKSSELDAELPVCEISTGLPYIIVPVNSLKVLEKVNIRAHAFEAFLLKYGRHKDNSLKQLNTGLYLFTVETLNPRHHFHARMFCLERGEVVEDAATGSAAGCLLTYLLTFRENYLNITIEQGYAIKRPSLIRLKGNWGNHQYSLKVGGKVNWVAGGKWLVGE